MGEDAHSIWTRCQPLLAGSDWQARKLAIQELAAASYDDQLLQYLLQAIRDQNNANLRNGAIEVLVMLGARVVPFLIGQLANADLETQKFLIDVLGHIGSPYAAPRLATLLSHYDQNIRFAAAEALGRIGSPLSADALQTQLASAQDSTERFILLQALTNSLRAGIPAELSLKALRPLRVDPLLTRALLELLRVLDNAEAFDYLWDWLSEFDELQLQEVARFLGKLSPDRLAEVTAQRGAPKIHVSATTLTNSFSRSIDKDIRNGGLWLAAWSNQPAPIFAAFRRNDSDLRHVSRALACLSSEQLQPLFNDIDHIDTECQRLLLGLIGHKRLRSHLQLALKLAADNVSLRPLVFRCCCELGHTEVLSWLPELLSHPSAVDEIADGLRRLLPDHRQQVLDILATWSDSLLGTDEWQTFLVLVERLDLVAVRNRVEQAWKRADPKIRAAALPILARFKLDFARHYLAMALVDENVAVRLAAAEILADTASEDHHREVRTLLVDREPWIRVLGVRTLAKLLEERAEVDLAARLQDRHEAVRIEALRCLTNLRLNRHVGAVRAGLSRETDGDALAEAIRYLMFAGQEPTEADLAWLRHQHWRVRLEALRWFSGHQRFREAYESALASENDLDVRSLAATQI